jgi:glycosyltransferase involved in cell wall biosynthesis
MNVRLVYRNYKNPHQIIMQTIENAPDGITYSLPFVKNKLNNKKLLNFYRRYGDNFLAKRVISYMQGLYFKPRYEKDTELLHIVDMIVPLNSKTPPFVIEVGHIGSLFGFRKPSKNELRKALAYLSHEKCKKIMPRSYASLNTIEKAFGRDFEKIKSKCEVVYPGIKSIKGSKHKKSSKKHASPLQLLFVGSNPWQKGLASVVRAVKELPPDRYELIVVSSETDTIKKNVAKTPPNIQFLNNVNHDDLMTRYFSKADIFIMPSHYEIFGMVYLEAFANGIPCMGVKQYSTPEIIEDGKNGYLLEPRNRPLDSSLFPNRKEYEPENFYKPDYKLVEEIKAVLEDLSRDSRKLNRLSHEAIKIVSNNGKFSINGRKRKLKKIYEKSAN